MAICICRTQPDLDGVIAPEIAIYDPAVPSNKLLLHYNPLLAGCWDKPWPPEDFVHFDHRQPRNIAQAPRGVDLPDAPRPMMTTRFIVSSLRKL